VFKEEDNTVAQVQHLSGTFHIQRNLKEGDALLYDLTEAYENQEGSEPSEANQLNGLCEIS
jgi:hypothetical protein